MTGEVSTDGRGRVTLPKAVRDTYGERYRLVELDDGIKLVPIPDDPLEALRHASSKALEEASVEMLRTAGRKRGSEEAEEHVR